MLTVAPLFLTLVIQSVRVSLEMTLEPVFEAKVTVRYES
jgi:hypothetical protein